MLGVSGFSITTKQYQFYKNMPINWFLQQASWGYENKGEGMQVQKAFGRPLVIIHPKSGSSFLPALNYHA